MNELDQQGVVPTLEPVQKGVQYGTIADIPIIGIGTGKSHVALLLLALTEEARRHREIMTQELEKRGIFIVKQEDAEMFGKDFDRMIFDEWPVEAMGAYAEPKPVRKEYGPPRKGKKGKVKRW